MLFKYSCFQLFRLVGEDILGFHNATSAEVNALFVISTCKTDLSLSCSHPSTEHFFWQPLALHMIWVLMTPMRRRAIFPKGQTAVKNTKWWFWNSTTTLCSPPTSLCRKMSGGEQTVQTPGFDICLSFKCVCFVVAVTVMVINTDSSDLCKQPVATWIWSKKNF